MDSDKLFKKEENERKNKIEVLDKKISDLKKQKSNYENDITSLKNEKDKLSEEVKTLSEKVKGIVSEAVAQETNRLKVKEQEVDDLRRSLTSDKALIGEQKTELEGKIKESKKKEEGLQDLIKKNEVLKQEISFVKDKLNRATQSIQEILNEKE